MFQPSLKHEDVPECVHPVMCSGEVFIPHAANGQGIEKTLAAQAVSVEKILRPLSQRPTEPDMNGDGKAGLGAVYEFTGDILVQYLFQQPLGMAVPNFHREWNPPR